MRYVPPTLLIVTCLTLLSGCGPALFIGGTATAFKVIHDRRTAATQLEDQVIEVKATSAFLQTRSQLDGSHINANSYNNVVLISGEVARPEIKQWAEDIVKAIDGVRFIHNELTVAPASSWTSRSNDSWITAKAKSSLLNIRDLPGFDPTRVKVVTERGIVYLFGLVTEQEGDLVTSTVRRLSGVQQVVKLFEYIPSSTTQGQNVAQEQL